MVTINENELLDNKIHEIETKLNQLEELLKQWVNKTIECKITVEELKVEQPHLDYLVFSLDSIDVKDLGGALTIGNNFGVSLNKEKDKKEGKNKKQDNESTEIPLTIMKEDKIEANLDNRTIKKHTVIKKKPEINLPDSNCLP